MVPSRIAVYSVVGAIIVLTVLTGPSVGLIQIQEPSPFGDSGPLSGNASVTSVEFPDDPTLSISASGQYVLRVGDADVSISAVTGNPALVYRIDVQYLEFSRTSLTILDAGMNGHRTLLLPKDTIAADSIDRSSYPARLRLILRGDGESREIAATNVTVSVDQ